MPGFRCTQRNLSAVIGVALSLITVTETLAQSSTSTPRLLSEDEEIRIALSAAPQEVSRDADVWVLRRGGHVKVRSGKSGIACMVSRDHPESLYPICYDAEAARTILPIALREQQLREAGKDDAAIEAEIKAAIERGEFKLPSGTAMSWMLSPHQVIFAGSKGPRVGKWHPHIMLYMPYATQAGLGYPARPNGDLAVREEGKPTAHLIIITPEWAPGADKSQGTAEVADPGAKGRG